MENNDDNTPEDDIISFNREQEQNKDVKLTTDDITKSVIKISEDNKNLS